MIRILALSAALAASALLGGCAGPAEPKWASDAEVARAHFVDDGPPSITLYTVISNATGGGAHGALLINADERIMFDPAGTWYHPHLPERNDVHFGITDPVVDFYVDYHTRETYRTIAQTIIVTPAQAAAAKRAALAHGAVPKAQCTIAVARVLDQVPGFESSPNTYFPRRMMDWFATQPGVTRQEFTDYDKDDNSGILQAPPVLYAAPNG